jgi:hypothetical protein
MGPKSWCHVDIDCQANDTDEAEFVVLNAYRKVMSDVSPIRLASIEEDSSA